MRRKFALYLLVILVGAAFVATDFGRLTESVAEAQQKRRPGVFQRLFGPRDLPATTAKPSTAKPPRPLAPRASSPTKRVVPKAAGARTLCVRTCDGYYFPISHSAARKRLKIDEAVCQAMYGGASANLYYYQNGLPADTAISLKGKPLSQEANAFTFRTTFSETCHAELKNGLARLGAAFAAKAAREAIVVANSQEEVSGVLPPPVARVIAGADPETISNRAGSFIAAPVLPPEEAAIIAASTIRKLGPDYYYYKPVVIDRMRDPSPPGPEFALIGVNRRAKLLTP